MTDKIKVLFVDDSLSDRHILETIFSFPENFKHLFDSTKYDIVMASSFKQATQLLKQQKFDSVVTDIYFEYEPEDAFQKFIELCIKKKKLITIFSVGDWKDLPENPLIKLIPKNQGLDSYKSLFASIYSQYILFRNQKYLDKLLRQITPEDLKRYSQPISHVETMRGTPEELRALVLEAHALESEIRNHFSGIGTELSRNELELLLKRLEEIKVKIRVQFRQGSTQRESKLKDGSTFRDRDWNSKPIDERVKENRRITPLRFRAHLK